MINQGFWDHPNGGWLFGISEPSTGIIVVILFWLNQPRLKNMLGLELDHLPKVGGEKKTYRNHHLTLYTSRYIPFTLMYYDYKPYIYYDECISVHQFLKCLNNHRTSRNCQASQASHTRGPNESLTEISSGEALFSAQSHLTQFSGIIGNNFKRM